MNAEQAFFRVVGCAVYAVVAALVVCLATAGLLAGAVVAVCIGLPIIVLALPFACLEGR